MVVIVFFSFMNASVSVFKDKYFIIISFTNLYVSLSDQYDYFIF